MGYKIGVPSLKLNNAGNRSKHCGSFGGVSYEGLEERKGLDSDINPEMSQYNVYIGYRSAVELMEYSERHLKELKDACGRGIRKDAVVMCATVFKPPAVYMNSLPMEDQQRLLGDCLEFIKGVVGADNVKAAAQHFDEKGAHMHVFWEPMTADGRLCAKELHNIKFFGYVNENLPAYLRERGWEIDDADCYDRAQREREDMEAEEERYQKRQRQGRSSAAYKLEAEQQRQELQRQNDELRLENSRLTGEAGLREIEVANLQDQLIEGRAELEAICEIKTIAERDQVAAEAMAQIDELQAAIDVVDEFCAVAEEDIAYGGPNLKDLVQNFVFDWRRAVERVAELLKSIRDKIRSIGIFEAVKNLRPEERVAGILNDSLAEKLAGAALRAGTSSPQQPIEHDRSDV